MSTKTFCDKCSKEDTEIHQLILQRTPKAPWLHPEPLLFWHICEECEARLTRVMENVP